MTPTSTKPTTLIALRHGGTHLIQPIIRHLTDKPVHVPKGRDALECVPSPKLVIFLRDPRNRMVSMLRYKQPKMVPAVADEALAAMIAKPKKGVLPVEFMLQWAARWASHETGLIVRFEQLMDAPLHEVEKLRAYLDAPGSAQAAVDYTLGKSGTFTGRHSRWREWFGPLSTKAWYEAGGDTLVPLMGYEK